MHTNRSPLGFRSWCRSLTPALSASSSPTKPATGFSSLLLPKLKCWFPLMLPRPAPLRYYSLKKPLSQQSQREAMVNQQSSLFGNQKDVYINLRHRVIYRAAPIDELLQKITRLRDSQKFSLALGTVDTELPNLGIIPDSKVWKLYLRMCEESRQPEKAEKALQKIRDQGLILDTNHYASLLAVMANTGRIARLDQLLAEMKSRSIPLDRNIYTLIISGLASNRKYAEMFEYYDEMKASGIRPDYITFTVLLKVVCREASYPLNTNAASTTDTNGASINSSTRLVLVVKDMIENGQEIREVHRLLLHGFGVSMQVDTALTAAEQIAKIVPEFNLTGFLQLVLNYWMDRRDANRVYAVLKKLREHASKEVLQNLRPRYEMLFCLFRERNDVAGARAVIADVIDLGWPLAPQMLLGSLELAINYNDVKQAAAFLDEIQKTDTQLGAQLGKNVLRLFWRFGRETPAKNATAFFKKTMPASDWREVEALIASENMGHLLPRE